VGRSFSAFREQTLADNLIAIFMNGIVAAYFWNILRGDWAPLTDKENFTDVRRLYRYIWMLYGLLITVFGAQQVLRFLFYIPGDVLGELGREVAVNGIALLVVGTPIWVYSWRVIQESLGDGLDSPPWHSLPAFFRRSHHRYYDCLVGDPCHFQRRARTEYPLQ
jgi:hypothetical protein